MITDNHVYNVDKIKRYWAEDRFETIKEAEDCARARTATQGESYGIFELKFVSKVPAMVNDVTFDKV